jgi:hypothetical protein
MNSGKRMLALSFSGFDPVGAIEAISDLEE